MWLLQVITILDTTSCTVQRLSITTLVTRHRTKKHHHCSNVTDKQPKSKRLSQLAHCQDPRAALRRSSPSCQSEKREKRKKQRKKSSSHLGRQILPDFGISRPGAQSCVVIDQFAICLRYRACTSLKSSHALQIMVTAISTMGWSLASGHSSPPKEKAKMERKNYAHDR